MLIEQIQIYFMVSFVLWSDTGKIGIIEVIFAHYDQFESIKTTYLQLFGAVFRELTFYSFINHNVRLRFSKSWHDRSSLRCMKSCDYCLSDEKNGGEIIDKQNATHIFAVFVG